MGLCQPQGLSFAVETDPSSPLAGGLSREISSLFSFLERNYFSS
jgi:hypothetical protein